MNDYTVKLSMDAWKVVGASLGKRPYEEVASVILSIESQIKAQIQSEHDKAADQRDTPPGAPAPQ